MAKPSSRYLRILNALSDPLLSDPDEQIQKIPPLTAEQRYLELKIGILSNGDDLENLRYSLQRLDDLYRKGCLDDRYDEEPNRSDND